MLPRSSGKPRCGQRLSSATTWPPPWMRRIGRWRPCTTSRPLAINSSKLPARTKPEVVVSIAGSSDKCLRQRHSASAFRECQSSPQSTHRLRRAAARRSARPARASRPSIQVVKMVAANEAPDAITAASVSMTLGASGDRAALRHGRGDDSDDEGRAGYRKPINRKPKPPDLCTWHWCGDATARLQRLPAVVRRIRVGHDARSGSETPVSP